MDMFMDKLAQRQTAHEIIKANTEADTKELNKFKNQVAGYNECLVKLQKLIDDGFVKLADVRADKEDTTRIVEESIAHARNLQQIQAQLDSINGMLGVLQEISEKSAASSAEAGGTTQEMLLQVDNVLQKSLGDMARAMQEQLGSINQRVQEELGNMGRAMQEQLERMGDIIQLQLKGMDKSVREQVGGMEIAMREQVGGMETAMQEQVNGMGIVMQEQLGSVGRSVQEQCGNMGRSMQQEFESVGGIIQERLDALDKSMQEQFAGMNKSTQGQIGDAETSIKQSMTEQLENLTKLLEEKYSAPEGRAENGNTVQLSENIHKECVKVYRNVQAVMVEESGKQSESLDQAKAGIASLKGKLGVILGISVAALVCSLAGTAFQILTSLNLIP